MKSAEVGGDANPSPNSGGYWCNRNFLENSVKEADGLMSGTIILNTG
jgi:hypothetical protein